MDLLQDLLSLTVAFREQMFRFFPFTEELLLVNRVSCLCHKKNFLANFLQVFLPRWDPSPDRVQFVSQAGDLFILPLESVSYLGH